MYLSPRILSRCRELRALATDAESLLWALLRNRQLGGFKFRRQHPVGPFILDFFCGEKKLAVELDGSHHESGEQAQFDQQRTRALETEGVRVIRFRNSEVLSETEAVLESILQQIEEGEVSDHLRF